MQEIVMFLKSLLSRKVALTVAALIANNMAKLPSKWHAIANMVITGLYFLANVAEKKVAPPLAIDADALAAQAEALAAGTTEPPALPGADAAATP